MTCEHNNGLSPCREPASWIGTDPRFRTRAFCDQHRTLHASFEGQHFIPLTPELETKRLAIISLQKSCPRCAHPKLPA